LKLQQKIEVPTGVFGVQITGFAVRSAKRASAEPSAQTNGFGRICALIFHDLTDI
jgi:hypothetical protein